MYHIIAYNSIWYHIVALIYNSFFSIFYTIDVPLNPEAQRFVPQTPQEQMNFPLAEPSCLSHGSHSCRLLQGKNLGEHGEQGKFKGFDGILWYLFLGFSWFHVIHTPNLLG